MNQIKGYWFEPDGNQLFPIGEVGKVREQKLFANNKLLLHDQFIQKNFPLKNEDCTYYLHCIEPYISEEFISVQNYFEIKKLAHYFNSGISSFFGFESHLNSPDARSDYLFAVSSKRGEREILADFLQNGKEAKYLLQKQEWQHLKNFTTTWIDPKSDLFLNVLGLWLEFDSAELSQHIPIPCVFIHTIPLRIGSSEEESKYNWVFNTAVSLLLGHPLSYELHQRLLHALHLIPEGASVMDIGFMLSRSTSGVRLVFKHLHPVQIIPYLKSLGWSDTNDELTDLIEELQTQVTRLILHITITEFGVAPKIGLECSFTPDQYHQETRWESFFEYLHQKGVCCLQKKTEILRFLGITQEDDSRPFDLASYKIAVLLRSDAPINALVRYISHVKLCYTPSQPLQAKAYPGVRLFGNTLMQYDYIA